MVASVCFFGVRLRRLRQRVAYVKCILCGKQKSLAKLRREIAILQSFYQQQPAYRLAGDLGLGFQDHYPGVSATEDGALSCGRTVSRQALGCD